VSYRNFTIDSSSLHFLKQIFFAALFVFPGFYSFLAPQHTYPETEKTV